MMMMEDRRRLVLTKERPLSWNALWSGKHWTVRSQEAQRVKDLVACFVDPHDDIFTERVHLIMSVYFDDTSVQPIDPSNICLKPYEDALIGRWITDDNMDYIASIKLVPYIDKLNPRIEIEAIREIRPSGNAERLTTRQKEAITWCAKGYTDDETSERMGISPRTVRAHLTRAKATLGARNRIHLIAKYVEQVGYVS